MRRGEISMKLSLLKAGIAAVALGLAGVAPSYAGAAKPVDLGLMLARSGDVEMTVTIPLKLRDLAGAEAMMNRVAMPGDTQFHKFLTPDEAIKAFGPTDADVARSISALQLRGLQVERATPTTLKVTGLASAMERVFQVKLHEFQGVAVDRVTPMVFHAPSSRPVLPAEMADVAVGVLGLNNAVAAHPMMRQAPKSLGGIPISRKAVPQPATTDAPGFLTVTDFEELYDAQSLIASGVTGKGRTVGVATLASVLPSDVLAYFKMVGVNANPNRLTVVEVDGGSGPPSDESGSEETALDLEQSGGIAQNANIIAYEAPNTNQGFVDVFAQAVFDNKADSISTSFGAFEGFFDLQNSPVTSDLNGETVSALTAMHQLFVLGALQGQSLFAAAGDCGAFDTFGEVPSTFTVPLSVDYPGDDSAIVSSGGTTLAGTQTFLLPSGATFSVTVPQQRVWGEDYLLPLCNALGFANAMTCGIFPEGTGGGISVFFPVPATQIGLPGVLTSQPGQILEDTSTTPPTVLFNFPANFPGRNVPDVSFNADPDTGYEITFTHDGQTSPSMDDFVGGTSFVGPQLNGVTALLGQNAGGQRFGLLSVPLYLFKKTGIADLGPNPPLHEITTGDNFFFFAANHYTPAGGLGILDVANTARLLK
jgi:kumamolisin